MTLEDDRLEGGESDEEKSDIKAALASILDPNNIEMITEIPNPLALTNLYIYAESWRGQGVYLGDWIADRILSWIIQFMRKMIPFERKRVMEAISMAESASGTARDREKNSKYNKLLGSLSE